MKNNLIALLGQTYPGVNALSDSPAHEDGSQNFGMWLSANQPGTFEAKSTHTSKSGLQNYIRRSFLSRTAY